ncbi:MULTISPECIES: SDR family NAD(P)-dependent oxidoreductase [Mycolicibacter]|uniref:Short-chain type dehydrogenase/reductase n=1 Tax=Mycolicibacter sinensis (strain JDM601) TaxID=875328 RepID=F5YV62_MYCSD|nr:SDR family NAD(P)-dependent oxidoreductase [Mycolicibacter sinensis]AEF35115.1 short-chain type dehydrogenase/reductase [Mycolicibacter sinensis]
MTPLRFDERVAVVTGAGRGVGRSHAKLLAAKGARVIVADHGVGIDGGGSSPEPADEVVREISESGGRAVACYASVAEPEDAQTIIDTAIETFGRIDVVVNNAGIHDPGLFTELSVEQFRRMLDVHYLGTVAVCRAAWPHFVAAGYGRVVNTVSEAMLGGISELTSYGAAKGAVFGLTRNLATEGIRHGIRVNAVAPRANTRMSASHSDSVAAQLSIPKDVMNTINASMPPELCAPAAAFLAHEDCPLNGEVLQIGMGGVARLAVVRTAGITKSPLSAEDIAENLEQIMNISDAQVTAVTEMVQ